MTFYVYTAVAVLFLTGLTGGILPFLSAWDRYNAMARKRSLYDKSAGQIETFSTLVLIIYAVILGADMLLGGRIDQNMIGPWVTVWELLAMTSALAALCATASLMVTVPFKKITNICSGLLALLGQAGACLILWAFCLGALTGSGSTPEVAQQAFVVLLDRQYWPQLGLFVVFDVLLGVTSAYGLSLCWHILCRNKDDFGRDFYSFVLGMRARQASYAGLLLLPVSVLIFVLYPLDPVRAQELMPLVGAGSEYIFSAGLLAFPLAGFLWYAISRASMPMQRRSLAFLAMIFLFVGLYATLVRF